MLPDAPYADGSMSFCMAKPLFHMKHKYQINIGYQLWLSIFRSISHSTNYSDELSMAFDLRAYQYIIATRPKTPIQPHF